MPIVDSPVCFDLDLGEKVATCPKDFTNVWLIYYDPFGRAGHNHYNPKFPFAQTQDFALVEFWNILDDAWSEEDAAANLEDEMLDPSPAQSSPNQPEDYPSEPAQSLAIEDGAVEDVETDGVPQSLDHGHGPDSAAGPTHAEPAQMPDTNHHHSAPSLGSSPAAPSASDIARAAILAKAEELRTRVQMLQGLQ